MVSIQELKEFEIFTELTDAELENICENAKKEVFDADKRIFDEKSWATNLYLVKDGRIEIKMSGKGGSNQITIDTIEPKEIFGWSAVTEPFTFTAAAWTKEKSNLIVLNGEVLLDLFKKNNHIGYKVMKEVASVISSRLRRLSQRMADSQ